MTQPRQTIIIVCGQWPRPSYCDEVERSPARRTQPNDIIGDWRRQWPRWRTDNDLIEPSDPLKAQWQTQMTQPSIIDIGDPVVTQTKTRPNDQTDPDWPSRTVDSNDELTVDWLTVLARPRPIVVDIDGRTHWQWPIDPVIVSPDRLTVTQLIVTNPDGQLLLDSDRRMTQLLLTLTQWTVWRTDNPLLWQLLCDNC